MLSLFMYGEEEIGYEVTAVADQHTWRMHLREQFSTVVSLKK